MQRIQHSSLFAWFLIPALPSAQSVLRCKTRDTQTGPANGALDCQSFGRRPGAQGASLSRAPHGRLQRGIVIMSKLVVSLFLFTASLFASASHLYVAQNATGTGNGGSCSNAFAVSFFNNPANWGSTSLQIGAGTTVHLCGTIATALVAQGSGASGNPITILFEPAAKISLASCGSNGCLNIANKSYLIVDGGSNGIIEAINSGTGLANGDSIGIFARPMNNSEIRNLSISNMYVHSSPADNGGGNYYGVLFNGNGNLIHNLTLHDVMGAIKGEAGENGNQIYNNTLYNINWGIFLSGGGSSTPDTITNSRIYNNDLHDFANWDTTNDTFHHDGIFLAGGSASNTLTHVDVYDNYIHGTSSDASVCTSSYGSCMTAYIYINTDSFVRVFNNLLVANAGDHGPNNAWILLSSDADDQLYNNTIIGSGVSTAANCVFLRNGTSFTFENNVLSNCNNLLWTSSATFAALNNNVYASSALSWRNGNNWYSTLAAWQAATSAEANSKATTGSLGFNASYIPQAGSLVIGAGMNLISLGIAALDYDKAGVARPATAWDVGAYQSSGAGIPPPPATYTLTVVNGTGDGSYVAGTIISIVAAPAPSGQVFLNWTGATVANPASPTTTLVMPATNATVTANYSTSPPPPPPPTVHPTCSVSFIGRSTVIGPDGVRMLVVPSRTNISGRITWTATGTVCP